MSALTYSNKNASFECSEKVGSLPVKGPWYIAFDSINRTITRIMFYLNNKRNVALVVQRKIFLNENGEILP